MPKQKSHKGLSKRIKITATGKVKRRHPGGGHLMSSKSPKRRRRLGKTTIVTSKMANTAKIKLCK